MRRFPLTPIRSRQSATLPRAKEILRSKNAKKIESWCAMSLHQNMWIFKEREVLETVRRYCERRLTEL